MAKKSHWFFGIDNVDDLKAEYKKLAKKLHPDMGGKTVDFQSMQAEFDTMYEALKYMHKNKDGDVYEKQTETVQTPEQFRSVVDTLIHFEDITLEIIGSWIWVTGNTMQYKDLLKEKGFWWSQSKQAWYYTGETEHHKRRGRYSLNKLRQHWGSEVLETEKQEKLA